jgi:hypothetical protein
LIEAAADAAVQRALFQTLVPVYRQGTVVASNPWQWIHQVLMDGDSDPILVHDISANGAFTGARVTVLFAPPHQPWIISVFRSQTGFQTWPVQWSCPAGTNPVLNNGILLGSYQRSGQSCDINLVLACGSTTTGGTNFWRFSLPFPAADDVSEQPFFCKAFTNGSVSWVGSASVAPGASTVDPLFPQSNSAVSMVNARDADGSGSASTGIPLIPLQFTWTGVGGTNLIVTGRYKVAR